MKILLVDDNPTRVTKLVRSLVGRSGLGHGDIINARSANEAAGYLEREKYDLLLIDLLIPNRLSDDPDVKYSLQLLSEIIEVGTLLKPRKIVGLTAYDDAATEAAETFKNDAWTLIVTSDLNDDWIETVGRCVDYIAEEAAQQTAPSYGVDVLILTALASEMAAVRKLPWKWGVSEPADDSTFSMPAKMTIGDRTFSVQSAHADRMGMVSSADLASRMIARFKPRLCIMTGICAGLAGRVDIGDVVFADCSWDYQSGKFTVDENGSSKFDFAPHQIPIDTQIVARVDELQKATADLHKIWSEWPTHPKRPFEVVRAPMACGSAVLADSAVVAGVLDQNRKIVAIEMESYGVLLAVSHASQPRPLAIVAKSVCDFADPSKSNDFQAYASYTSAQAVRLFLENYLPDLVPR